MSVTAELEKLEAMRKAGTITEEEFVKGKRRILDGGLSAQQADRSSTDWRLIFVCVIAFAAIGVAAWGQLGIEPEPAPEVTLAAIVVAFFAIIFARPLAWFGFWWPDFGGGDETVFPLLAVVALGAVALAGGAFLIGLPLIALGLAAVAAVGAVMWAWDKLFDW
ncbi:MAG: SHOCT domain-containing protein [Pseudomonadota bacterium]